MNNNIYMSLLLTTLCASYCSANFLAILDIELSKISKEIKKSKKAGKNTTELHDAINKHPYYELPKELTKEKLNQFIKDGKDINSQDNNGNTALHTAIIKSNKKSIKSLINAGINKDIKNNDGKTALHIAVENQNTEFATLLINAGINKDIKNNDGKTALHIAVENQDAGCAIPLINTGANKTIKNNHGKTAQEINNEKDKTTTKYLLINYALKSPKIKQKTTELHDAINKTSNNKLPDELTETNLLQFIKDEKDINSQDDDGNTALHIAVIKCNAGSIRNLLTTGINRTIKNNDGKTAKDLNEDLATDYCLVFTEAGSYYQKQK